MIIDTIKFNAKFPQTILQLHIILLITVQVNKKNLILLEIFLIMSIMLIQIRSVTKSDKISLDKLNYYKSNFVNLVNSENKKIIIGSWPLSEIMDQST